MSTRLLLLISKRQTRHALKERLRNFEGEKVTKNRALEYADTALSVGSSIIEEIQLHITQ